MQLKTEFILRVELDGRESDQGWPLSLKLYDRESGSADEGSRVVFDLNGISGWQIEKLPQTRVILEVAKKHPDFDQGELFRDFDANAENCVHNPKEFVRRAMTGFLVRYSEVRFFREDHGLLENARLRLVWMSHDWRILADVSFPYWGMRKFFTEDTED